MDEVKEKKRNPKKRGPKDMKQVVKHGREVQRRKRERPKRPKKRRLKAKEDGETKGYEGGGQTWKRKEWLTGWTRCE